MKYENAPGDAFKFFAIVGLIAAILAVWLINPSCGKVDIAPDNNSVNVNGAQRQAIEEQNR